MLRDRRRARGRWLLALAGVLALLLLTAPAASAQQASGQQQPGVTTTTQPGGATTQPGGTTAKKGTCDNVTNPVLRKVCQAGTAPAGAVGGAVTAATAGVVASAGDSALRSFTNAVAQAGQWFLDKVGKLINGSTSPNVTNAGWFISQYRIMLAIAIIFALPMLLVSVAQAIVKADMSQAIRSAFVYLPIAGVFSFAAPACAQILIDSTDWLTTAVGSNGAANAEKFLHDAGGWLGALGAGTANPVAPVFGVLLAAIIVVLGAISIWIELILRSAAIYIAVLFLPIAFAAMVWPRGWPWCKRLIEFLIAIIFAKVFIVAIINLAAAGLARGGLTDKFEGVLAGGALLLMAAFTPVALLKLIPLAEAAVVTAGTQRAALRQATSGATALTGSSMVSQMIQSRFRQSATGGAGAGAAASAWGAPVAAGATVVSAARNRAASSFAAAGETAKGGSSGGAGLVNVGGSGNTSRGVPSGPVGGATGGGVRPPRTSELVTEGKGADA
jgi:hypothetical protein